MAKRTRAVANIPSASLATCLGSVRIGSAFSVNELQTDSAALKSVLLVNEVHADSTRLKAALLCGELHADSTSLKASLLVSELHADSAAATSALIAGHFAGRMTVGEEAATGTPIGALDRTSVRGGVD
jgi:hypothetical protein